MVILSRPARGSRRRARARIVRFAAVACAVILSVATVRPAAGGTRPGDEHSDNVSLLSQLDLGSTGEMAFWGDRAVVALEGDNGGDPTNDGFALVDISQPARPREISRFMCSSSSFDIAIWQDLVFLSSPDRVYGTSCKAKAPEADESCDPPPAGAEPCFAGLRRARNTQRSCPTSTTIGCWSLPAATAAR